MTTAAVTLAERVQAVHGIIQVQKVRVATTVTIAGVTAVVAIVHAVQVIKKMSPTYTLKEALTLMYQLDREGLSILESVVNEETDRYSLDELEKWDVMFNYYICQVL
jgi:hypothetical protein